MTETKVCRACGKEKPVSEFYTKRVLINGSTLYRPDCKECNRAAIANDAEERERIRLKTAEWRAADPERSRACTLNSRHKHIDKRRAEQTERRHNPETRDRVLEVGRVSYQRNKEKRILQSREWALANHERVKTTLKAWWMANPDKAREYHNRRRALLRESGGKFTANDVAEIRLLQRGRCAICRKLLKGDEAVDHIKPLALGGTNDRRNLQIVHKVCNSRKRTKDSIEFMQSRGLLL